MAGKDEDSDPDVQSGILITSPEGVIYNIPIRELSKFRVPDNEIDATIVEAERYGFFEPAQEFAEEVPEKMSDSSATIINIFVGQGGIEQREVTVEQGQDPSSARSFSPASTMSKYAAGSTMSKYAAGSTMSKYAAGSTMSKYAAGSTMAVPQDAGLRAPVTVFYGRWKDDG